MTLGNKILTVGSLALSISAATNVALAQSAGDEIQLEPINVVGGDETSLENVEGFAAEAASSATRGLPGDLAKTPRSVSVITTEQLEAQGVSTLEEAIAYTPGLMPQTFGMDGRYDQFAIRGFESQNSSNYRDGMPLRTYNFAGWRTETYGLERIEVLRGPTADLYGANEPGGLVNSVTKRPKFTFGSEIQGKLFGHGGGEVAFDVTGPVNDVLAYRFVGVLNDSGTVFDDVDQSRIYLAPSFTWKATDRTNITVFAQYQKDEVADSYVLVPQYGSQLPNPVASYGADFYTGDPNRNSIETTQNYIGYELDHELTDALTFRSRARFARNDWDNRTIYNAAFFSSTFQPGAIDSSAIIDFDVNDRADQLTFDNGLEYKFNTGTVRGSIIGGIDYYELDGESARVDSLVGARNLLTRQPTPFPVPVPLPLTTTQSNQQKIKQTGVYLLGLAEFGDNWLVNGSLRWDRVDVRNRQQLTPPPALGAPTTTDATSKDNFTSASLGASYTFENGVSLYGNAARSFNLPPQGFDANGNPLKVEESMAFEVGARFRPAGTNSLFSLALFDITKQNTTQPVTGSPGRLEQVGEIRSRGAEIGVTHAFDNGLSVLGAYTYVDAKITKNAINQGNRVARVPEHTASLWLGYDFARHGVEGLTVGGGARYVGERFSDSANSANYKVDDLLVFDASVSYAWGDWRATLAARNLADKQQVTYCQGGTPQVLALIGLNPGVNVAQAGGCAYGAGRTVELTLTRRF